MNSFHLGRMCCQGRFVDNSLQIQKGEVRFARRKRPLLHFRIHENGPPDWSRETRLYSVLRINVALDSANRADASQPSDMGALLRYLSHQITSYSS
jgi:hypothetical protein